MYRNILVAIDGSPTAGRALQHASELAAALHAKLTVMSVVPSIPGYAYAAGVDVNALKREAEREVDERLRAAVDALPGDITVSSFLRHGDAGHEIVKALDDGGYDLLVLGSRGRGRMASTLFGSVGAAVHFHTHVPMLVVHPVEGEDG
jgi:nucleotide-binding universal stress UspA family protein